MRIWGGVTMTVSGWIILTFVIVCYLPFFIWLSASYLSERNKSKRQRTFWGFLVIGGLLNSVNTFYLKIQDTYFLAITILYVFLFTLYLLITVLKDKREVFNKWILKGNKCKNEGYFCSKPLTLLLTLRFRAEQS